MGKDKNDRKAQADEAAARAVEGESGHPQLLERGSLAHLPLGRVAPRHDPRTLRLAKYLDDAVVLPEIPDAWDWTTPVASWPMYGNDSLGDCTIAATAHMVQAWAQAAGTPVTPDEAAVIAAYWETGSSDTGRFEVDVLNYWRNAGIAGHKIEAYAYVDPQNLAHVRAAIYLFGGVYTGIALPQTAQSQQVWDVAGDPHAEGPAQAGSWGGHAVPYAAFGGGRFRCVTWGHVLDLTDAFHLAYCDELYAPISLDFLRDGVTPAGFDAAALAADLAEITRQTPSEADLAELQARQEEQHDSSGQHEQPDAAEVEAQVDQGLDAPEAEPLPPGLDSGYYWNG